MSSHSFSALLLALVIYSYSIVTMLKHNAFISTIVINIVDYTHLFIGLLRSYLQGFSTEQEYETYVYSMNIGIDMVQFMVFTIILAVIAAVIDLTITSSPIYELHQVNPTLTQYELFQSGMRVGREILMLTPRRLFTLPFLVANLLYLFGFSNLNIHLVIL
ncbi:YibE/F family protein [Staphylococcus aureus]